MMNLRRIKPKRKELSVKREFPIELPEGVTPTITDRDFTVATIAAPTIHVEEEEETEGDEDEEGLEGEEGEDEEESEE